MSLNILRLMNIDKKIYDQHISLMCSKINIGSRKDLTINELAETIKQVIDFKGRIIFDSNKPDGIYRKPLDCAQINNLGLGHVTRLKKGLIKSHHDYFQT